MPRARMRRGASGRRATAPGAAPVGPLLRRLARAGALAAGLTLALGGCGGRRPPGSPPDVVPGREPVAQEQLPLLLPADGGPLEPPPPTRHPWAWLLRRVFAADMARCPNCAGRVRLLEVVTDPNDIARVRGEPARAARAPLELDFCAA